MERSDIIEVLDAIEKMHAAAIDRMRTARTRGQVVARDGSSPEEVEEAILNDDEAVDRYFGAKEAVTAAVVALARGDL